MSSTFCLQAFDFCLRPYELYCFRYSVGVCLVYFLKAVLNEDFELKPTSYSISNMVRSFLEAVRQDFHGFFDAIFVHKIKKMLVEIMVYQKRKFFGLPIQLF